MDLWVCRPVSVWARGCMAVRDHGCSNVLVGSRERTGRWTPRDVREGVCGCMDVWTRGCIDDGCVENLV